MDDLNFRYPPDEQRKYLLIKSANSIDLLLGSSKESKNIIRNSVSAVVEK